MKQMGVKKALVYNLYCDECSVYSACG